MQLVSSPVIDSDQHLYETRTMWLDHIDPGPRATTRCASSTTSSATRG